MEQQRFGFCEPTGARVLEVAGNVLTQAWDRSGGRESEVTAADLTVEQLFDRAIAVVESGGSFATLTPFQIAPVRAPCSSCNSLAPW